MKFSPTVPLALALTAGMAGAALAQTATTSPQPGWNPSHPESSYATQPQASSAQPQQDPGQAQPNYPQQGYNAAQTNPPMQSATGQAPASQNDQVRQTQAQLQAAGLYNGPVDGLMDPDTRAAIARFQQQNGLRRTEQLDQQTTAQLLNRQTTGFGSSVPGTSGSMPNTTPGATSAPAAAGGNATGPATSH